MTNIRRVSLQVRDEATQSIINQGLYFREQSPDSLLETRWHEAVTRTVDSLLLLPTRGTKCSMPSQSLRGLRRMAVNGFPKYFLFYLYNEEDRVVNLVDVVHGARDLDSYFDDTSV